MGVMNEQLLSKGKFAEHIGVSAGRITQMIAEGLIGQEALTGTNRNAKIKVALAVSQINERRDIGQALGNGLTTNLNVAPKLDFLSTGNDAVDKAVLGSSEVPPNIDQELKLLRLEKDRRANRRDAEAEALDRGRLMESDQAIAEMNRLAAQMMNIFDGMMPEFANEIAAKFEVPQRDVLHLLRQKFTVLRASAEAKEKRRAENLPVTKEVPLTGVSH